MPGEASIPYREPPTEKARDEIVKDATIARSLIRVTPVSADTIDVETRSMLALVSYVGIFLMGGSPGILLAISALVTPEKADLLPTGIWLTLGVGGGSALFVWLVSLLSNRWKLGTIRVSRTERKLVRQRGLATFRWRELVLPPAAMIVVEEYRLRAGAGRQTVTAPAAQVSVQVGRAPSADDIRRQSELLPTEPWRRPPVMDGFAAVANHVELPLALRLAQVLAGFLNLEVKRLPERISEKPPALKEEAQGSSARLP